MRLLFKIWVNPPGWTGQPENGLLGYEIIGPPEIWPWPSPIRNNLKSNGLILDQLVRSFLQYKLLSGNIWATIFAAHYGTAQPDFCLKPDVLVLGPAQAFDNSTLVNKNT